jgi:hypothetical protein
MSDPRLEAIREIIQEDVGNRGLRTDPTDNLITRTAGDFAAACWSIAEHPAPSVCIVTGFFIAHGQPPACETDGPLGAIFLTRALLLLNVPVLLVADPSLDNALEAGLDAAGFHGDSHPVATASIGRPPHDIERVKSIIFGDEPRTHLIALERVGPSHADGRCYSMRGRDITEFTGPAHLLFEHAATLSPKVATIGIGDGGNEIGMGKLPWDVIRRNIPNGGLTACRVPCDHLLVAGVSNWGAYGLAAGVRLLLGAPFDPELFDVERERKLLRVMVEQGPLIDGVTGKQTVSVDGLDFDRYAEPLRRLAALPR